MNKVNFIKHNLLLWQGQVNSFKSRLLIEFGKYQTDKQLLQVQQLTLAMIEITKFESYVLEKIQEYALLETEPDQDQIDQDIMAINRRLRLFIAPYRNQLNKDQFANSKSLAEYDDL